MGKSSLIDHGLDELREAARFRIYRGSTRESTLGYGPFASLLRWRFGLAEGMSQEAAQTQIRAQVSSVLDDRKVGDVCFFLGQILDIPFPDSPLTKAFRDDPGQGLLVRRAIIKNFFESDASHGPICLVLDDLDVAGEDSVGFVAYLIEHLTGPVLLICSMRPEMPQLQSGWFALGSPRHERADLGPLSHDVARSVMRTLLAPCEGGAPDALVEAGIRLADGNVGRLAAMVALFHDCGALEEATPPGKPPCACR